MTAAEIESRIEAFIRTAFAVSPGDPGFGRSADLFEGGYVDSVGVVELLAFMEAEFGVEVPEDDLLSDDFSRIDGIARIVERLHADGSA
jgi:acyl carrier protein